MENISLFNKSPINSDASYTMEELGLGDSEPDNNQSKSQSNDYININKSKRSTQNERLRNEKSQLQQQLSQMQNMYNQANQKALDLESQHLRFSAEAAMETQNPSALISSITDLVKTETQKSMYSGVSQPQNANPYDQKSGESNSFYTPEQSENIDRLLGKFKFLDPSQEGNYSPTMFADAERIQKDLLSEFQRQGRGNEEFGPEFTHKLEEKLNMHFNGNNSSNNRNGSARMVAPVTGQNNSFMDSNIALAAGDHDLIREFKNQFKNLCPDVEKIATESLKNHRLNPERTSKSTLMKDMISPGFNEF